MRENLPVTGNEFELDDVVLIQSRTDLAGRIIGANANFVEISGYSHEELIGQPHNIVRHPDMPPAVFEDMWKTLKVGRLWDGVLKNRRKNGDYYWVKTSVAPQRKDDKVVGYVSSRWKVAGAERARMEAIYREIRTGNLEDFYFSGGNLERRTGLRRVIAMLGKHLGV